MKLGEALTVRARQAQRLNDLQSRIRACSLVQEGSTPPEDPEELVDEYLRTSKEHSVLVANIVATNSQTLVDGAPLANLLQAREALIRARNLYGGAAQAATKTADSYRFMRSELKFVPAIEVVEYRRAEDELAAQVNALDARIQQINWETDLVEV